MLKRPLLNSGISFLTPEGKPISNLVSEFENGGQIQVWVIDKRELNDRDSYLRYLSNDELEKAQKFRFEKDFSTYVIARGILKKLLSKYIRTPTDAIGFVYGDYGKPKLKNSNTIHFNVSHSNEMIVLAVAQDTQVGVDVEYRNDTINLMEIANTVFTETEIEFLNSLQNKEVSQGFYHLWTRKEAFIKLSGYGLSMPIALPKISVLKDQVELLDKVSPKQNLLKWDCVLRSFSPDPDYAAAIVASEGSQMMAFMNWNDYKHTLHIA
ncbi:4'-phosphopantetheinyl transferase superfamily protein [uncultured Kriegella sp.]|uniref:4'-phosphopantetheinyl transferase superfamily protein n=1 Tax=uncultured Kriegella sp. TaxID=1798910 RepID=UPI0030DAAAFE